jgi:hypothetical protein
MSRNTSYQFIIIGNTIRLCDFNANLAGNIKQEVSKIVRRSKLKDVPLELIEVQLKDWQGEYRYCIVADELYWAISKKRIYKNR